MRRITLGQRRSRERIPEPMPPGDRFPICGKKGPPALGRAPSWATHLLARREPTKNHQRAWVYDWTTHQRSQQQQFGDMKHPERKACGITIEGEIYNNGKRYLSFGLEIQRFKCRECGYRFSDPASKTLEAIPNNVMDSQQKYQLEIWH